jgi:hypothetical protein
MLQLIDPRGRKGKSSQYLNGSRAPIAKDFGCATIEIVTPRGRRDAGRSLLRLKTGDRQVSAGIKERNEVRLGEAQTKAGTQGKRDLTEYVLPWCLFVFP